ncbi:MAG: ABC transporter substrate-binding protein [Burkholderiales bacterium]
MPLHRRRFLAAASAVAGGIAAQRLAHAQQARTYRVIAFRPTPPSGDIMRTGLPAALAELGYVEGQNLSFEMRYGDGNLDRMPALAREIAGQKPDVILAISAVSIKAARAATSSIPIVFFGNFDPVGAGFVKSLAQPGGNVTGVVIAPDGTLAAKRMELLVQAVNGRKRMAMLLPEDPNVIAVQLPEARKAAASLGVQLDTVQMVKGDYAGAFAKVAALKADSLFLAATTYFVQDRRTIIDLAAKHQLPAIYEWPEQVEDGGLMSYGPSSLSAIYRRIASCIDRILKGADPASIPVEQPAKLELVVNLKTARAMGLALPQSVLLRADRVIQ